jgi:hypothetical protein
VRTVGVSATGLKTAREPDASFTESVLAGVQGSRRGRHTNCSTTTKFDQSHPQKRHAERCYTRCKVADHHHVLWILRHKFCRHDVTLLQNTIGGGVVVVVSGVVLSDRYMSKPLMTSRCRSGEVIVQSRFWWFAGALFSTVSLLFFPILDSSVLLGTSIYYSCMNVFERVCSSGALGMETWC